MLFLARTHSRAGKNAFQARPAIREYNTKLKTLARGMGVHRKQQPAAVQRVLCALINFFMSDSCIQSNQCEEMRERTKSVVIF